MIKNFSIFKQDNKGNEKLPTHGISTKIGEEYVNIGACWTKDSTKGKYLSCKLSDVWVDSKDNTKSRKSYVIVSEEELYEIAQRAELEEKIVDPKDGRDLTPDDSNPF